jgi:3-hydroxyisobutyrate dehydrogenase-like beta-hydroxyacid dehydrogenase
MGTAMARRLLAAGERVLVWNRTAERAQALVDEGASRAGSLAELAACPVVFVMVSGSADLVGVLEGDGLLAAPRGLRIVVDCSTVSAEASAAARALAAKAGVGFAEVERYLLTIGKSAVRVGDQEQSRLVKLCHNLYLGMLVQALVEVTTLAEKGGADREAFLRFLGDSVVGSDWVRGRSGALAARDWTPTFTTTLLRKDFDLGLAAAREHEVPLPVAAAVHQLVQSAVGHGLGERDLLALYEIQSAAAALR